MTSERSSARRLVPLGLLALTILAAPASLPAAAQSRSNMLLVMVRVTPTVNSMLIINPLTGKTVGRVPIHPISHGVAASSDGKLAFGINTSGQDDGGMAVIDLVAQKEVHRFDLTGQHPHDIQFAGGRAYFTAAGRNAIGRYDPVRNQTDWLSTAPHSTRMIAIDEARNTIYATSQPTKSLLILEGMSGNPSDVKLTAIPLGHEGEDLTVSPDGKQIWTANPDGSGVSIIDVAARKVLETIPVRVEHANRLKLTPDGKHVFLLDRDLGLTVVLDTASRKEIKRITHTGRGPGDAVGIGDVLMDPDGAHAYITVQDVDDTGKPDRDRPAVNGHHYVAVIDLKTLEVTRRIETEGRGDELAWAVMK